MRITLVLALLLAPLAAWAHPLDLGYLSLQASGERLQAQLDLGATTAMEAAHLSLEELRPEAIGSHAPALVQATLGSGPMEVEGKPCRWERPSAEVRGIRVVLLAEAVCAEAPGRLRWTLAFLDAAPLGFRLVGRASIDGHESEFLVERGRTGVALSGAPRADFWGFVALGVRHIGALPSEWRGPEGGFQLPDGIDHILFLLALLLAGGGLKQMLKTVTGFTAGHSVTLALATLGVVQLPPRLTESAIALSIAYVAAEDLLVPVPRHRWRIAALFGLVHGFGFAGALGGLHLSRAGLAQALVGFNVGVEVGQALIVLALSPLLLLALRVPRAEPLGLRGGAAAIFCCGAYWFVRRAFF